MSLKDLARAAQAALQTLTEANRAKLTAAERLAALAAWQEADRAFVEACQ